MDKKTYDIVYLTNTPSFYKLNLCNEIAKTHSLLLVLQGRTKQAVNASTDTDANYDTVYLYDGDMDERPKAKVFLNLLKLMRSITCKKILYSGWMAMEYNIYSFLSPREKNVVVCESSCYESHFGGVSGVIKKLIIGRMSSALPSGVPHARLFKEIGFKGDINITGGVGLFNKGVRTTNERGSKESYKYICVARLTPVKNLKFLIDVFNKNGRKLTIVGRGELEKELKSVAKENITFLGFVENEKMGEIYAQHDIFVLPSSVEPWGLVVDEALYWGLPVIVSDMVGANIDLVKNYSSGVIFDHKSEESLISALAEVERNYQMYITHVNQIDFNERDRKQIAAYNNLFDKDN